MTESAVICGAGTKLTNGYLILREKYRQSGPPKYLNRKSGDRNHNTMIHISTNVCLDLLMLIWSCVSNKIVALLNDYKQSKWQLCCHCNYLLPYFLHILHVLYISFSNSIVFIAISLSLSLSLSLHRPLQEFSLRLYRYICSFILSRSLWVVKPFSILFQGRSCTMWRVYIPLWLRILYFIWHAPQDFPSRIHILPKKTPP